MNRAANEMALPFLIDYSGQFILLSPAGTEPAILSELGNMVSPATLPVTFVPYHDQMTFTQRFWNTLYVLRTKYAFHKVVGKPIYTALKEQFSGLTDMKSYYLEQSGILINRHYLLDGPIPLLPNQVEIGCITCKPAQPLPKVNIKLIIS